MLLQRSLPSHSTPSAASAETLSKRASIGGNRLSFGAVGKKASEPSLLTPAEKKALQFLNNLLPQQPENIISFTDPGKDPDDTMAAIIEAKLHAMGHMNFMAAVTTLGTQYTREIRARLLKGTLKPCGIEVPVAAGARYAFPSERLVDDNLFFDIGHELATPGNPILKNANALLKKQLEAAAPNSVTLSVIAGMTDVAGLIRQDPKLFQDKVKQVVIMGGVKFAMVPVFESDGTTIKKDVNGKPVFAMKRDKQNKPILELDGDGHVQPDTRAFNNTTDQQASMEVYKASQVYKKPLVVLTKEAAYQAPLSNRFYEDLLVTRHPLAKFLSTIQFVALQRLWWKIHFKIDKALTMPWFLRVFTNVDEHKEKATFNRLSSSTAGFDEIWKRATKLNAYDPLTVLASLPNLKNALFQPQVIRHPKDGSVVEIIGDKSVKNPQKIQDILSALCKGAFLDTKWSHLVSSFKEPVIV